MGIAYAEEVATTVAKLPGVMKEKIHASSDWTHVAVATSTTIATSTVAAGATSLVVASATGIAVGGILTLWRAATVNGAATPECRVVSAVAGTTISWVDPLVAPNGTYQVGDAIGVGSTVTATTTRGAVMVVDLLDAAITAQRMQFGVYNGLSGTTPQNKVTPGPYIYWKAAVGATTDIVRCTVSAGKEHLFVAVEGPRLAETNADSTAVGSTKQFFALSDIVPYFSSPNDVTPAVCLVRNMNTSVSTIVTGNQYALVSKDAPGTSNWVSAGLETLSRPQGDANASIAQVETVQTWAQISLDGSFLIKPWVVMEDVKGLRGTLARFWFGGRVSPQNVGLDPTAIQLGTTVTYGGVTYKAIAPLRGTQSSTANRTVMLPMGDFYNYLSTPFIGPVLFVPVA